MSISNTMTEYEIERKLRYIYFSLPFIILLPFYFTYRYVTVHHVSSAIYYILPPLIALIFIPFIYRKTGNYNLVAAPYITIALTVGYTLIFMAGGVKAPGLFWMMVSPILGGTIWGKRGGYLGVILVIIAFAIFWKLESLGIRGPVLLSANEYQEQKIVNFILLSLFSFSILINFIRTEDESMNRLQSKTEQIDMLMRLLVHDVANALTVLKMDIRATQKKQTNNTNDNKQLTRSEHTISTLEKLLIDVTTLKMIDDETIKIDIEPVNINVCIQEAIDLVLPKAEEKKIEINLASIKDNISIMSSHSLLKTQVLVNILNNSIKFSSENDRIDISCRRIENEVKISIQDYGIGIPTELIPSLSSFERKTNRRGTHGELGTGHGIPILVRILEILGGTIDIDSIEQSKSSSNHGTTMTITFQASNN
ncbi:MAG: HAMP domain-containing histidine kinase [Bdellovibrionales bacterium]|jgi:signal transduction histidine kinase|nr:HAMP domain-containing histidine kinase [Bdellovibrionales bacterium]MBT3525182.1 HAMP domain-containing histidine kinase [Bdellovibrionales bacterium]MBT7670426.1 HAMP domain-containing histidine kinase [Bdellovibrionales bacterium]MBT7766205.1 HAMP domain-containing histidine kinase [Bdellovibrionales bacterium]